MEGSWRELSDGVPKSCVQLPSVGDRQLPSVGDRRSGIEGSRVRKSCAQLPSVGDRGARNYPRSGSTVGDRSGRLMAGVVGRVPKSCVQLPSVGDSGRSRSSSPGRTFSRWWASPRARMPRIDVASPCGVPSGLQGYHFHPNRWMRYGGDWASRTATSAEVKARLQMVMSSRSPLRRRPLAFHLPM